MAKLLRPNHSTALPGAVVILDTEALEEPDPTRFDVVNQKLYFGKAVWQKYRKGKRCNQDSVTFTKPVELWQWLLPKLYKKTSTWLFAHNLGYDLTLCDFWQLLEARILSLHNPFPRRTQKAIEAGLAYVPSTLYVDADPPTIIRCYDAKGGQLVCVDSLNYFPFALSELGDLQGIPKLERPDIAAPDRQWEIYNDRDVQILQRSVTSLIDFVRDNDYGKFRWTAAGQAKAAFRHRFCKHAIDLDRPPEVMDLERQAYYGGRVEVLKTGVIDNEVFELDVSSMYPSVMIDGYFPCKLEDSFLERQDYDPSSYNPGLFTVAECLVDSKSVPYPIRCKDGTYYCTGRFWTTLCGSDLQQAVADGHVREYSRWARYRLQMIFHDYVEHFWNERQRYAREGNHLYAHYCKLFLNSLYGKFGQQSARWEDCDAPFEPWLWGQREVHDKRTDEWRVYRSIGGHTQMQVQPTEHPQSFTAISAWVTAYARQRMRQLVSIAGNRNVYYVVNDALYVNRQGLLNLQLAGEVVEGKLGKLRQKRYGKNAEFWAANNYRIGDDRIVSGVHKKAERLGLHIYREISFQRIKDIIAQQPKSQIDVKTRDKILVSKVKRCGVDSDGWTVPHHVLADHPRHLLAIRDRNNLLPFQDFLHCHR